MSSLENAYLIKTYNTYAPKKNLKKIKKKLSKRLTLCLKNGIINCKVKNTLTIYITWEGVKMIKISRMENGALVEYEYTSISNATRENGATSGMNRNAGLRFLEKAGFDISTLVETEKKTRTVSTLIERFIKECATIDRAKIKEVERERMEKLINAKTSKDMDELLKLNQKIVDLQNPTVNREQLHAKLDELYDEYLAKQAENETTE